MKKRGKWFNSFLWTCGALSGPVIYLLTAQLSYALTESFSVSAAYVGIIFMASRVFDGVTDFIAGNIIDRTHNRFGKARIYELFMILAWVFVIFCFSVPTALSEMGKLVFVFIMYNMYTSVFSTLASCADTVRLKRSLDDEGRIHAVSVSGVVISIVSTVVSIALPIMIAIYASQPGGWTRIAIIFAIPCCILTLVRFIFMPEMEVEEEGKKEEKISALAAVKQVLKNKYVVIVMIATAVQALAATTASSMSIYYFTYVYGDVAKAAIPGFVSAVVLLGVALMPVLIAKWGKSRTIMYTLILGVVASLLRYFVPTNLVAYTALTAVYGFAGLPLTYIPQLMLIDIMEYSKWKDGVVSEGVYSAVRNIANKVGLGLGAGLMGLILQLGALPDGGFTKGSIMFLNNGFAAIAWIIAVIALVFYDLDKKMLQISKESAE